MADPYDGISPPTRESSIFPERVLHTSSNDALYRFHSSTPKFSNVIISGGVTSTEELSDIEANYAKGIRKNFNECLKTTRETERLVLLDKEMRRYDIKDEIRKAASSTKSGKVSPWFTRSASSTAIAPGSPPKYQRVNTSNSRLKGDQENIAEDGQHVTDRTFLSHGECSSANKSTSSRTSNETSSFDNVRCRPSGNDESPIINKKRGSNFDMLSNQESPILMSAFQVNSKSSPLTKQMKTPDDPFTQPINLRNQISLPILDDSIAANFQSRENETNSNKINQKSSNDNKQLQQTLQKDLTSRQAYYRSFKKKALSTAASQQCDMGSTQQTNIEKYLKFLKSQPDCINTVLTENKDYVNEIKDLISVYNSDQQKMEKDNESPEQDHKPIDSEYAVKNNGPVSLKREAKSYSPMSVKPPLTPGYFKKRNSPTAMRRSSSDSLVSPRFAMPTGISDPCIMEGNDLKTNAHLHTSDPGQLHEVPKNPDEVLSNSWRSLKFFSNNHVGSQRLVTHTESQPAKIPRLLGPTEVKSDIQNTSDGVITPKSNTSRCSSKPCLEISSDTISSNNSSSLDFSKRNLLNIRDFISDNNTTTHTISPPIEKSHIWTVEQLSVDAKDLWNRCNKAKDTAIQLMESRRSKEINLKSSANSGARTNKAAKPLMSTIINKAYSDASRNIISSEDMKMKDLTTIQSTEDGINMYIQTNKLLKTIQKLQLLACLDDETLAEIKNDVQDALGIGFGFTATELSDAVNGLLSKSDVTCVNSPSKNFFYKRHAQSIKTANQRRRSRSGLLSPPDSQVILVPSSGKNNIRHLLSVPSKEDLLAKSTKTAAGKKRMDSCKKTELPGKPTKKVTKNKGSRQTSESQRTEHEKVDAQGYPLRRLQPRQIAERKLRLFRPAAVGKSNCSNSQERLRPEVGGKKNGSPKRLVRPFKRKTRPDDVVSKKKKKRNVGERKPPCKKKEMKPPKLKKNPPLHVLVSPARPRTRMSSGGCAFTNCSPCPSSTGSLANKPLHVLLSPARPRTRVSSGGCAFTNCSPCPSSTGSLANKTWRKPTEQSIDFNKFSDMTMSEYTESHSQKGRQFRLPRMTKVQRLTSHPCARWPLRSGIPLLTSSKTRPAELVRLKHRRCLDNMTNGDRPSKIPVAPSFMKTLITAAEDERSIHCWTRSLNCEEDEDVFDKDSSLLDKKNNNTIKKIQRTKSYSSHNNPFPWRRIYRVYIVVWALVISLGIFANTFFTCTESDGDIYCKDENETCINLEFLLDHHSWL